MKNISNENKKNEHEKCNKTCFASKTVLDKYKFWQYAKYKKIFPTDKIEIAQNYASNKTVPEISQKDIEVNTEWLKYKMGKYLANNMKKPLTFKMFLTKYWKNILIVFLSAVIFNFGVQAFLSKADTIPSGITGVPTLLQQIFPKLKPYFALIYLACNIPLFLCFGWKLKKSFFLITLLFMIFQILINLLLVNIDFVREFITNKIEFVPMNIAVVRQYLYGDEAINHLTTSGMESLLNEWKDLNNWNDQSFEWIKNELLNNYVDANGNVIYHLTHLEKLSYWYDTGKTWPILIYGALGAIFIGIGVALSWKAGGSTGGTDIIAYYFSYKTKKSIGNILSVVAIFTAIIFLVIYAIVKPNPRSIIIGTRELSTFSYIVISNLVVNKLYPKYKKINLTIISSEPEKIIAYFKLINYWHSYRIIRYKSGYTGKYGFGIETSILLMEAKNLVDDLKLIDPNIWISQTKIDKIYGKFNIDYVE
ncbi:YitT family protein [Mycoplasmopsis glycophila]|uniref:Uncharacterized BCR, YitT family COG1284 n=1 Tax=Mycoplasmopsis glycophila TaxID=171285 RepID=A0A449AUE4_9BACT|nr:YitT family protein [Mycoplasmopsis glycophila]VEU70116.1 Uncharacterized BCR, YitT family COG1284 [Mycoplasmopsis glycophila]